MNKLNDKDQIKLVILDLDETFWKGTLSEGTMLAPTQNNLNLIKTLVDRGIMVSISSKNDFEAVKNEMEKLGIWDLFVFPAINWNPKGQQIKNIIEKAQLQPKNVLFIDDNHLNLQEALFYLPELKTEFPDILPNLLDYKVLEGKNDVEHTRLYQYKILEEKDKDKQNYSSNEKFLKSSNIKIYFELASEEKSDRIVEMIARTNQLNYTKKRIEKKDLLELLKNKYLKNVCIYCTDKYGDYGMIGFYSYNKKNHKLEHFLFSCRTMNLGIEQYVYNSLNDPELEVVGVVSTELKKGYKPNWIKVTKKYATPKFLSFGRRKSHNLINILLLGNCDVHAIEHYIIDKSINILSFIDFSEKTKFRIRHDSLFAIRQNKEVLEEQKKVICSNYPFLDIKYFENRVFAEKYDVLIVSLLNDYLSPLYKDKETGVIIQSTGDLAVDLLSENPKKLEELFKKVGVTISLNEEDIKKYQNCADSIGFMSPEMLKENLLWLADNIKKKIIFINGPEIKYSKDNQSFFKRFTEYNKILDEFLLTHKDCFLVDLRKFVNNENDVCDTITHFSKKVYIQFAEELKKILKALYPRISKNIKNYNFKFINKLNNKFFNRMILPIFVWRSSTRKKIREKLRKL